MSQGEFILLIVSIALGPVAWTMLFYRLSGLERLGRERTNLWILAVIVIACTLVIAATLRLYSSPDVRDAPRYLALYLLLGLSWLRMSAFLTAYAGVSLRDDVIERNNPAAQWAIAGALLGATFCFAGGNIGSGPGWWVVVWCSTLATACLGAAWLLYEGLTSVADSITIDRDAAAGVRLGGLLASCGLILGRAVAGDWVSFQGTLEDLVRIGSAVLPLIGVAILVERSAKSTVARPHPSLLLAGVLPALAYSMVVTAYVAVLGPLP